MRLNFIIFIHFKQADIAAAPLTVTEAREKVVDFTVPFMFCTDDILLKRPSSHGKYDLLQFMNPFHNEVWFCTLATLVVISVAVFFINYYSPYGYKDENGRGTSQEFSYFNSVCGSLWLVCCNKEVITRPGICQVLKSEDAFRKLFHKKNGLV